MESHETEIPKLYYSIGEVSKLTGLDAHVLRYWETEFRELSPRKNRGGKRLYRENDVKLVLQIKELLYDKRFTIEGARLALKNGTEKPTAPEETNFNIEDLRKGLIELKSLLE